MALSRPRPGRGNIGTESAKEVIRNSTPFRIQSCQTHRQDSSRYDLLPKNLAIRRSRGHLRSQRERRSQPRISDIRALGQPTQWPSVRHCRGPVAGDLVRWQTMKARRSVLDPRDSDGDRQVRRSCWLIARQSRPCRHQSRCSHT